MTQQVPTNYAAEAAGFYLTENFGNTALHPLLTVDGGGTQTLTRVTGKQGRGGIVKMSVEGGVAKSGYLAWGPTHQPAITVDNKGPIWCNGGGHIAARLGSPNLADVDIFVGWLEETDTALAAGLEVRDFLGVKASSNEIVTSGASFFAGLFYSKTIPNADGRELRAVHFGGDDDYRYPPVKTPFLLEAATNPNDGNPLHMPELRVDLDADGDVHCRANGQWLASIKRGVAPGKAYRGVIIVDNSHASAVREVWFDSFIMSSQTFPGLPPEAE